MATEIVLGCDHAWVKFRAGLYGAGNAVLGAVFFPVFGILVGVCCIQISGDTDVAWSCVGGFAALMGCLAMAGVLLSGVSTWRAVVLSAAGVSVPGFSFRRGLYRDDVPLADVSEVALIYHSQPRNGRWQLQVIRRHGRPIHSDSITSSRSRTQVKGTPAWHTVQRLRSAIRDAQHPTS